MCRLVASPGIEKIDVQSWVIILFQSDMLTCHRTGLNETWHPRDGNLKGNLHSEITCVLALKLHKEFWLAFVGAQPKDIESSHISAGGGSHTFCVFGSQQYVSVEANHRVVFGSHFGGDGPMASRRKELSGRSQERQADGKATPQGVLGANSRRLSLANSATIVEIDIPGSTLAPHRDK